MEPKLNFQVPAEGLEMLILLHRQCYTLEPHKSVMHHHSLPFFYYLYLFIISNFQFLLQKGFNPFSPNKVHLLGLEPQPSPKNALFYHLNRGGMITKVVFF